MSSTLILNTSSWALCLFCYCAPCAKSGRKTKNWLRRLETLRLKRRSQSVKVDEAPPAVPYSFKINFESKPVVNPSQVPIQQQNVNNHNVPPVQQYVRTGDGQLYLSNSHDGQQVVNGNGAYPVLVSPTNVTFSEGVINPNAHVNDTYKGQGDTCYNGNGNQVVIVQPQDQQQMQFVVDPASAFTCAENAQVLQVVNGHQVHVSDPNTEYKPSADMV